MTGIQQFYVHVFVCTMLTVHTTQVNTPECEECQNGGQCRTINEAIQCLCPSMYTGDNCATYVLPLNCSFEGGGLSHFEHLSGGQTEWKVRTVTLQQTPGINDFISVNYIVFEYTGIKTASLHLPLPRDEHICVSFSYTMSGTGTAKLSLFLNDSEIWHQSYSLSPVRDYEIYRQQRAVVSLNTSPVDNPQLTIVGEFNENQIDPNIESPAFALYNLEVTLDSGDSCDSYGTEIPFTCYFNYTWCGFSQNLNDKADWMIVNSQYSSHIKDRFIPIPETDCPFADMEAFHDHGQPIYNKCKELCMANVACVNFLVSPKYAGCYTKSACRENTEFNEGYLFQRAGYLATPAFELDISDRRDAKLDLFVHISGPVCLQVIYINCVKDLKMKILLKTSDNDYITVLRDTGENTCDEKTFTYDILEGTIYTLMRFNAVCFNDCMKNAGISGLREMHITNESCQYPSEHTEPMPSACMTPLSADGSCYWPMEKHLAWSDGNGQCELDGGHLAIIQSEEEQSYIYNSLTLPQGGEYWIGLQRYLSGFYWTDGSILTWRTVDGTSTWRKCGLWQISDQQDWMWEYCALSYTSNYHHKSICEANIPIKEPCRTVAFNGRWCYWVGDEKLDFTSAREACQAEGGDITTVESLEEQNFIVSQLLLPPEDYWIGLKDYTNVNGHGDLFWISGKYAEWTNWFSGEPDSDNSCVRLKVDTHYQLWRDKGCANKYKRICKALTQSDPRTQEQTTEPQTTTYSESETMTKMLTTEVTQETTTREPQVEIFGLKQSTESDTSVVITTETMTTTEQEISSLVQLTESDTSVVITTETMTTTGQEISSLEQSLVTTETTTAKEMFTTTKQESTEMKITSAGTSEVTVITTVNRQQDGTSLPDISSQNQRQSDDTETVKECETLHIQPPLRRDSEETRVGSVVTYWCDRLYHLEGTMVYRSLVCTETGQWNAQLPHCQEDPSSAAEINETVNLMGGADHSVYQVYCKGIQTLNNGLNSLTIPTEENRYLQKHRMTCEERCPPLQYIEHAEMMYVAGHSLQRLSVVMITCHQGYRFSNGYKNISMHCLKSGMWDHEAIPKCLIITCPPVPRIQHTEVSTELAVYESVVEYKCMEGLHFMDWNDSHSILCQDNGQWNNTDIPRCIYPDCGSPPGLSGASLHLVNGTTFGSVVTYTCEGTGLFSDGHSSRTAVCSLHNEWKGAEGNCTDTRCPYLDINDNTVISSTTTEIGTSVRVTCKSGYVFDDASQELITTCQNINLWSHSVPKCEIGSCPVIVTSENMMLSSTQMSFNTVITVSCNEGFVLYNHTSYCNVTCTEQFIWSTDPSSFHCTVIECPDLQLPRHSLADQTTGQYSDTITVYCRKGYWFRKGVTSVLVTCQVDGTWDIELEQCSAITCPSLPSWHHLHITDTVRETYTMDNRINYTCQPGFSATPSFTWKVSTCNSSGQWEPSLRECKGDYLEAIMQKQTIPSESPEAWRIGGTTVLVTIVVLLIAFIIDMITFSRSVPIILQRYKHAFKTTFYGIGGMFNWFAQLFSIRKINNTVDVSCNEECIFIEEDVVMTKRQKYVYKY